MKKLKHCLVYKHCVVESSSVFNHNNGLSSRFFALFQNQSIQQLLQHMMTLNSPVAVQDLVERDSNLQETITNDFTSNAIQKQSLNSQMPSLPNVTEGHKTAAVTSSSLETSADLDGDLLNVLTSQDSSEPACQVPEYNSTSQVVSQEMADVRSLRNHTANSGQQHLGNQVSVQFQAGNQSLPHIRDITGNVLIPDSGMLMPQLHTASSNYLMSGSQDSNTSGAFNPNMLPALNQLIENSDENPSTYQKVAMTFNGDDSVSSQLQPSFGVQGTGNNTASFQSTQTDSSTRANTTLINPLSFGTVDSGIDGNLSGATQTQTLSDGTITISIPVNVSGNIDVSNIAEMLISAGSALRASSDNVGKT